MTRTFVESFELFHGPVTDMLRTCRTVVLHGSVLSIKGIASLPSAVFIRKFLRFPFNVFRGLFLRWESFLSSNLHAYVLILIHLSVLQLCRKISFMRCLSLRIVSWRIPSVLRSISISEGFAAPSSTSTCFQVLAGFETTVFSLFLCFDLAHQLAPVSKCLHGNSQQIVVATGAAELDNDSWVLSWAQIEAYKFFRTRFDLLPHRPLSRCNPLALDRTQLWHWFFCLPKLQSKILRPWQLYSIHSTLISFPLVVILDFSWFWKIFAGFFLIWICSKELEGREEDFCLPSLLPFPPATSPVLRTDKWSYEQPWLMNSFQLWRMTTCPSIQARWSFLQCVPESLEHTSVFLSNFRNIRTLSCCFPY